MGHFFGIAADVVALAGGTATSNVASGASLQTRGVTLETDAAYSPSVQPELDGHWSVISAMRSALTSMLPQLSAKAAAELIRQVDLDATLPSKDLTSALKEVRRQMIAGGYSIASSTVSAGAQSTVLATGTPKLIVSMKTPYGEDLATPFAETLRFTCTTDSQTGGASARQETLTVTGAAAVADAFDYRWPGGSGCSVALTLSDAQGNNSRNTYLVNGSFETASTTNTVDNWVYRTGVATTDYTMHGSGYTLSNALRITSDGSTLYAFYQPFNTASSTAAGAGGTPAKLKPSTVYGVGFFTKVSATPSAGVLRVALVDGSNTVINDGAGNANSFTVALTGLNTSYAFKYGVFRTPSVIPSSGVRLEFKITTALDSAKYLVLDDVVLAPMTQLYNGGPFAMAVAGDTNPIVNDQWTVAISSTMGSFAMWLERFFGMRDRGVQWPGSGSPTISDSVVA